MNLQDLEIIRITRKHAICFCPNHKDTKTPNLYITLTGDYYGSYYCFACGFHGHLPKRAMESLDLKKQRVDKPVNNDWLSLSIGYFLASYKLKKSMELAKQLSVSESSVCDFGLGWDGEAFTVPMENAKRDIIGIHRRFPSGKKCCVEGSQLGLFIPCGFESKCNETLFICEGFSDTVSVYDLGFFAIGKPSCSIGNDYIRGFVAQNKIKYIVLIPDNDNVGYKGMMDLKLSLQQSDYITYSETIFHYDIQAKDIREYVKLKGKSCVQKELQLCLK